MADIKDILGVSREGMPAQKAPKQKEPRLVKPKGMSRCVAGAAAGGRCDGSQASGRLCRLARSPAQAEGLLVRHWPAHRSRQAGGRAGRHNCLSRGPFSPLLPTGRRLRC